MLAHDARFVDVIIEAIDSLCWVDDRRNHNHTYFNHIAANLTQIDGLCEGSDY